jgi:hypothetical protein
MGLESSSRQTHTMRLRRAVYEINSHPRSPAAFVYSMTPAASERCASADWTTQVDMQRLHEDDGHGDAKRMCLLLESKANRANT